VARSHVNEIYGRSVLTLVKPQSIEGFGLVPLESLASGRPVVAVPTGEMDWVIGHPGGVTVPSRGARTREAGDYRGKAGS
jgi:glycosyltransferase involved in cell wall biosynthesis